MNDLFQATCECCGQPLPSQVIQAGGFHDFWDAWPRKVGKATAEKMFGKLSPADRKEAIGQAPAWLKWWQGEHSGASHIHASTYLNQRRWEDDTTASNNNGTGRIDEAKERALRIAGL